MEAVGRIDTYVRQGREVFERDELIQVWVVYHLQLIGEAARGLSQPFRTDHPEIPWAEIVAMRNILVHDYDSPEAVRRVVATFARFLDDP